MHSTHTTNDLRIIRLPVTRYCLTLAFTLTCFAIAACALSAEANAQNSNTPQRTAQRKGSLWLKPFQWTNPENQPASKSKSAPSKSRVKRAVTSSGKPRHARPVQYEAGTQSSNPFSWSNEQLVAEATDAGESRTPAGGWVGEKLLVSDKQVEIPNPLTWSNETKPTTNAASLMPPKQISFSEAVQQSLRWQEEPNAKPDTILEKSTPPADATDEQLVEWEKEHYPWSRPFYWSEPEFGTPEALALEPEPEFSPTPPASTIAPLLTKPFQWTNRPARSLAGSASASDARTVAYFQDGEELPLPTGTPNPAETLPPAGESSDDSLSVSEDGEEGKGTIGQAETLGREPVDNSLQFLRTQTVLLKPGEAQWDYGIAYTLFDQTIPVAVSTPTIDTVELARFRRRELILPLELRYGLARRIQLFLNVPFGWSNTEFAFGLFDEFENTGGIGDIIFGSTFLLRQGNHEVSDAIMTLAVTAPTGQDPFAPVVGLTPSAPALGGGTWSLASSLLFVRNYDPVVLFYGFGTRQHLLREVRGRNFRIGGEYNYQMGVGFAVNEKVTFSSRFSGAYISETRVDGERIKGSIQEPMTVGLALTVSKRDYLIEPFVDFGLTSDSTNARFGVTWTR